MKPLIPLVLAALSWGVAAGQSPPSVLPQTEPPLLSAARTLDARQVLRLLPSADVSSRTDRNESALHLALLAGDARPESRAARLEIVEALLLAGLDSNSPDRDGLRPLHLAALKGRDEAITPLLSANADPAAPDNAGRIALHYAAMGNHKAAIERLLAARPVDPRSSRITDHAAYVDARDKLGETPLHVAARRFRTQAAELLIASGADVNARNARNQTPLHLLCRNKGERVGHDALIEFARLLLSHDADVNARDDDRRTPLFDAIESEAPQLVEFLRSKGGVQ